MLDSYIGTIDYDGEGIEEAQAEVDGFLKSEPILDCSWVVEDGHLLLAASLISLWERQPLVGYVMTRATAKGQGVAGSLLEKSIADLQARGWESVDAFITSGNTPSERLFVAAGAVRVTDRAG
jgi:hypothetical protein